MEKDVKPITIPELYKQFGLSITVRVLELLSNASPRALVRIDDVPYRLVHEVTID